VIYPTEITPPYPTNLTIVQIRNYFKGGALQLVLSITSFQNVENRLLYSETQ